jgi:hypothetical protein
MIDAIHGFGQGLIAALVDGRRLARDLDADQDHRWS